MFRSTRTPLVCAAFALSALIGSSAFAQTKSLAQPSADQRVGTPSMAEIGLVLDYANAQPEFLNTMKQNNIEKIRALLLSYGMPKSVKIDEISNTPITPYTDPDFLCDAVIYYGMHRYTVPCELVAIPVDPIIHN